MFGDVNAVLGMIALLLGITNTLAIIIERWQRPSAAKIEKLICDVDAHDSRLQSVESDLRHLPTKDAVGELTVELARMAGNFQTLDAEVQGVGRAVRRIEDHILKAVA